MTTPDLPTLKRQAAMRDICEDLAHGLSRAVACNSAGVSRQSFYSWLKQDRDFAREIELAEEEAASAVEAMLYQCAMQAGADPRYQRSLKLYLDRRDRRKEKREEARQRRKAEDRLAQARQKKAKERADSPLRKHLNALARIERETAWLREEAPPSSPPHQPGGMPSAPPATPS